MKTWYKALALIFLTGTTAWSQEAAAPYLTLEEAFGLALKNSAQLKVSATGTRLAKDQTAIVKLNQLPGLSTGINYGYISNSEIWSPSFEGHRTVEFPHTVTQFSLQAAQLVFKGGLVKGSIERSELEEQVAQLRLEKNTEDIKFLVAAKYLDIYRTINQRTIFANNLKLSQQRLDNVQSMFKQGMVTQNDVLRNELITSNLELAILKADNTIIILNQQLNVVLGLEQSARLTPDPALLALPDRSTTAEAFLQAAKKDNRELQLAAAEKEIAAANIKIAGSDRYPELSLYAGSNLQRPFLNSMPAVDIFYNVWQAGVSLRFNIASVYQAPRRLQAARTSLDQSGQRELVAQQDVELAVNNSFIRYREAIDEVATLEKDLRSAQENYRIVEKKYLNQLALLADMTDAANIKIEAELRLTNTRINIIYTYYQLLKSAGML